MYAIKNYFFPARPVAIDLELEVSQAMFQGRERILMSSLRFGLPLSLIGLLSVLGNFLQHERLDLLLFYMFLPVTIAYASLAPKLTYHTRTLLTLLIIYILGTADLILFGVAEDWRLHYAALLMLTTLFLGRRAGFIALFLCVISFITIAWLISIGFVVPTMFIIDNPIPDGEDIYVVSLVFVFVSSIVIMALSAVLEEFENAWQRERLAIRQLSIQTKELEDSLNREHLLANRLEHSLSQQEELNRLKSRIIATVSHEFRTPLTVINSSAGLLMHHAARLSEQKREEIYQRIRRSIFYLTDLLQDVVWVDTSNSSEIQLRPIRIAFNALCESLAERLHRETDHPANLTFKYAEDNHTGLYVDAELIKQVLFNLLTNSLKYSPMQTPIVVHFECNHHLHITVMDQGIGIPPEELERIWELFYRSTNVETFSGLGLGLYNVQKLVAVMGGDIEASSGGVNQGCSFHMRLPLHVVDTPDLIQSHQRNLPPPADDGSL